MSAPDAMTALSPETMQPIESTIAAGAGVPSMTMLAPPEAAGGADEGAAELGAGSLEAGVEGAGSVLGWLVGSVTGGAGTSVGGWTMHPVSARAPTATAASERVRRGAMHASSHRRLGERRR
ncbi:hypothetical protein GCM10009846_15470 [Agrococcus versicolor]|uniref:Uncharacterized protein n=1 Tax=Agrococcus versicolor TaxID=501482 RepID=A0ABN3AQ81_9MICO